MPPLSSNQNSDLSYHYEEGKSWLAASNNGKNTTALSYAAFEFRLSIERIILQYWSGLVPGGAEELTFKDIRSYKSIEKQIFQIAGHQKEINAKFEFARLIIQALKIPWKITTPEIGKFSHYWHECSELCHIAWTLASANQELTAIAYSNLVEISDFLNNHVEGVISFVNIEDMPFRNLQDDFVAGRATSADVLNHLKTIGVYAVLTEGKVRKFIGEAIPPSSKGSS
jgi:hypothetical protein